LICHGGELSLFSGIVYHFAVAGQSARIVLINGFVTDAVRSSFHTRGGDLIADHLGWRIDSCQPAQTAQYWLKI
jgi:hypothetical protein